MRLVGALLTFAAAAALTGCSSDHGPVAKPVHSSCSGVAGKHHAYVVVMHASGTRTTGCVGFDTQSLSGFSLMKDSGIGYQTQSTQYGPAMCEVDGEPAHYAQCLPANAPYWAAWTWNGTDWSLAQQSFADIKFKDHQALGWVYAPFTASPAPPPAPPAS